MRTAYWTTLRFTRLLVAAFFRRVEVAGLENLPGHGGGVLVSWHPNGLIDPGLILACFPRQVVFGARDGLFRWPGLGWLMRSVGTVPIYRSMDARDLPPERLREANEKSLDALARAVADGQFSCLFPEGDSHDAPHLLDLKTGAARFYYRAKQLQRPDAPPPVIIPVGLHYDEKQRFRSTALVVFHPPMTLPSPLSDTLADGATADALHQRNRALTGEIERVLREVVRATETWELHHLMHRARKLLRAERGARAGVSLQRPDLLERQLGFARVWSGYYARRATEPEAVASLVARVAEYDADMRALGIEDHELDRGPRQASLGRATALAAQVVAVYLLLPPLLVFGGIVNIGPYLFTRAAARLAAAKQKDTATIKLFVGAPLYTSTWLAASALGAWQISAIHALYPMIPNRPFLGGLSVLVLAIVGGMVSLRYLRLARETARALRVRLTRARRRTAVAQLLSKRSQLTDALDALGEGLGLPGDVAVSGAVTPIGRVQTGEVQTGEVQTGEVQTGAVQTGGGPIPPTT